MESILGSEILQPDIVCKLNWSVHVKQECILINTALGVIVGKIKSGRDDPIDYFWKVQRIPGKIAV
ncbi:unnamed protein product [Citrullus colocynthis]|uniref:Uncharacterized protein n=1 Tax=Citrullus colocynthis TaxID=252529 RepID=A0ABP0YVN4_9ROSI